MRVYPPLAPSGALSPALSLGSGLFYEQNGTHHLPLHRPPQGRYPGAFIRGDMMEKYRTSKWSSKPEPVLVVKETEHFISYRDMAYGKGTEQRSRKDGNYYFHDSWEGAKQYLVQRAVSNIEDAKRDLDRARSELEAVKRMKKPCASPNTTLNKSTP